MLHSRALGASRQNTCLDVQFLLDCSFGPTYWCEKGCGYGHSDLQRRWLAKIKEGRDA
jgi:hypothetical protein